MGREEPPFWVKGLREFAVLSSELTGSVGAGIGLAYLCQRYLDAPSWVLMIGALAGLTLAIVRMYLRQKNKN